MYLQKRVYLWTGQICVKILEIIIVVRTKHKSFSRRLVVRVQEPINNLTNLITTMIVYNVTTFINIVTGTHH